MTNAYRDQNNVTTALGILNTDGITPVNIYVNPATNALKISDGDTNALQTSRQLVLSQTVGDNDTIVLSDTLTGIGQSFMGNGETIGSIVFKARRFNNPTGLVYAKIYAHSGTFGTNSVPTGAALATSEGVDVTTISSSFGILTPSFVFSGGNQIVLSNGTPYVLTIEFTPAAGTFLGPVRSSTNVSVGNFSYFFGGSWIPLAFDLVFYLYNNVQSPLSEYALRDQNFSPVLMGVSSADGVTPIPILVDSSGNLLVQST